MFTFEFPTEEKADEVYKALTGTALVNGHGVG
jgi:hypothetical protein